MNDAAGNNQQASKISFSTLRLFYLASILARSKCYWGSFFRGAGGIFTYVRVKRLNTRVLSNSPVVSHLTDSLCLELKSRGGAFVWLKIIVRR